MAMLALVVWIAFGHSKSKKDRADGYDSRKNQTSFVQNNSAIRTMFEEGNHLKKQYGADKVYDFSLGNPSVPAPDCVREAIVDLADSGPVNSSRVYE